LQLKAEQAIRLAVGLAGASNDETSCAVADVAEHELKAIAAMPVAASYKPSPGPAFMGFVVDSGAGHLPIQVQERVCQDGRFMVSVP
jgi:hypothetical protein